MGSDAYSHKSVAILNSHQKLLLTEFFTKESYRHKTGIYQFARICQPNLDRFYFESAPQPKDNEIQEA